MMKAKAVATVFAISMATLIVTACGSGGATDTGKQIKSTTSNDLTITLASPSGELKSGENELTLTFADASSKPVDVGAASLNFYMPAMGSMAEMNDGATLTTTGTPGVYRAKVNIEVEGTWEAQIKYQGPKGTGQANMTVNAK